MGQRSELPKKIRIIGGTWRSRLLSVMDLPGLRPSTDRIRETLFNWLGQDLTGLRCLDLFAGTGALGFQTASIFTCIRLCRDIASRQFGVLKSAAKSFKSSDFYRPAFSGSGFAR